MNERRLLIGLLLLATALADCAVLAAALGQPHFPNTIFTLAWALQLSQVSLAAIWLALGSTPGPLRLMGVVVSVALWSCALPTLPDAPKPEHWAVLLMGQTILVSVPLLVARWLGLEVVDTSVASRVEGSATGAKRWQFSIAYLLGWMTAVAVMLGTLQWIAPYGHLPFGLVLDWSLGLFVLFQAALAWSALWTLLGTGRPAIRILPLFAVGATAVIFFPPLLVGDQIVSAIRSAGGQVTAVPFFPLWFLFRYVRLPLILLVVLLLLGSLAVCRTAGFRLRWREQ